MSCNHCSTGCDKCSLTVITKQGERGIQGPFGPPGRIGPQGEAVVGEQGPVGATGADGATGATGPSGGSSETMVFTALAAGTQTISATTPADLVASTPASTDINFLKIATNMWLITFETRPTITTSPSGANVPFLLINIDVSTVTGALSQIPYGVATVVPQTVNDFQNYDLKYAAGARVILFGTTLQVIIPIDTANTSSTLIIAGSCFAKT